VFAEHPQILLLILLIPASHRLWRAPGNRALTVCRGGLLLLAILYLAGLGIRRVEPGVDVIAVVDRSRSVGQQGRDEAGEILGHLDANRGEDDRIGVVLFGEDARLQSGPARGIGLADGAAEPGPDGSDLAAGLSLAGRAATPRRRTRVVILSDGLFTGRNPVAGQVLRDLHSIPVSYRRIGPSATGDVFAGEVRAPGEVSVGTGFVIRFSIISSLPKTVKYTLRRMASTQEEDGVDLVIAEGTVELEPGRNQFFARDLAESSGLLEYELEVEAPGDVVAENNTGRGMVRVIGAPQVLLLSGTGKGGLLAESLRAGRIPLVEKQHAEAPFSAASLDPYRVVVLENLPLDKLGRRGAKALADAVDHGVCSLLVTGGEGSFGLGGYHKSPLDRLLPVSMELREEERRARMALAIVMDRSGSMAMQAGGGKSKMDLANAAAAESVHLLTTQDLVTVIAVDSTEHIEVPLSLADETGPLISAILSIQSMGGGIFVHTGLQAAATELEKTKVPTRHILLFSDARDSEEQSGCIPLARKLAADRIGISVVGLGTPADSDAQFLRDLAAAGGGEIYFTNQPQDLPRIFSQEVIRISQRGFIREPTMTRPLADTVGLGVPIEATPELGGYNLTRLRSGASCALLTADEYEAPVIAWWQKGRAVAGAIAAEVDGPYSGGFATWQKTPKLLVSLVRRLASGISLAPVKAYSTSERGEAGVRLEFGERLGARLRAEDLHVNFLPPGGEDPIERPLRWLADGAAEASLTMRRPGHYLPVVDLGPDLGVVKAPPVSLAYSPEYLPSVGLDGDDVLERLGVLTGGNRLVRAEEAFRPEGAVASAGSFDLRPWIAGAFVLLLLVEMAERRLAVLSLLRLRRWRRSMSGPAENSAAG
jgi:Mg-chelatase subunit ChlD